MVQEKKVYDEIAEEEIEEIWTREDPDEDEPIGLNGKNVWETASECVIASTHMKS